MAKKKEPVKRRIPLSISQKEYALAVLIRHPDAFEIVKDHLPVSAFELPDDRTLAIAWATISDFYKDHGKLPKYEQLVVELDARISITDEISDDAIERLEDFVNGAYAVPDEELDKSMGLKYVTRMLNEYVQQTLLSDMQNGVISDMPSYLRPVITQLEVASSLNTGRAPLPFPDTPEKIKPLIIEPTGVPFLDHYMNGGMARKEVNGFCGPYGSCKTTLGIQLCIERARYAISMWLRNGSKGLPERVYFISYEEDQDMLQPRLLSYAGGIHRRSLEGANYIDELSRAALDNFKPYERILFRNQIDAGIAEGEYERMKSAMAELNQNMRILDFSGSQPYASLGTQMVPGIAAAIERDQAMDNYPGVALVVVDYAGAAAKRAIAVGNGRLDDMRHYVGGMPMDLKNLVAIPYNCQVWCLHQLGTEANSREAGVAPKSTDAAEAKNFFENVNFGFMVGKPNNEGLTVLTNQKQRRAERKSDIVIKIDGGLSRVEDASKHYMVDNRTITSRADASQLVASDFSVDAFKSDRSDALFKDIRRKDKDIGL